ncbi:MAG TPA: glutamate 5-kinase [Candidatus Methylacidiphilales bacterium]|nr:glutamate 5-kinase [Candidatus Methylacidiphilales bacterium]
MSKSRLGPVPKRWVVKLGTGILSDPRGRVDLAQIDQLTSQVTELRRLGHQILIVSSGAVGCGMSLLGLGKRPTAMAELQACAALGQPRLMSLYNEAFERSGIRVAQVLLTYLDLDSRSLYRNIQRSVEHLLARDNIVPIFNENDVVSYEELVGPRFGDNDQLSAHIAILARAERLVILSNVRGLATNPDGTGRLIRDVRKIDARIQKLAGGTQSQTSVGGMAAKLKAARLANEAGIPMQIAHGRQKNVLVSICQGEAVGTMFHP